MDLTDRTAGLSVYGEVVQLQSREANLPECRDVFLIKPLDSPIICISDALFSSPSCKDIFCMFEVMQVTYFILNEEAEFLGQPCHALKSAAPETEAFFPDDNGDNQNMHACINWHRF